MAPGPFLLATKERRGFSVSLTLALTLPMTPDAQRVQDGLHSKEEHHLHRQKWATGRFDPQDDWDSCVFLQGHRYCQCRWIGIKMSLQD